MFRNSWDCSDLALAGRGEVQIVFTVNHSTANGRIVGFILHGGVEMVKSAEGSVVSERRKVGSEK